MTVDVRTDSLTGRTTDEGQESMTATTPDIRPPLLSMQGVTKRFGAVEALIGVDFEVRAHEVVALVGDNGAGKSTLIKCLSGVHMADTGSIFVEGKEVKITTPSDATRLGVETVYQDLALCDNLDIVHNLYLGRELTKRGVLDEATMEKRATETLAGLSVRTVRSIRQQVADRLLVKLDGQGIDVGQLNLEQVICIFQLILEMFPFRYIMCHDHAPFKAAIRVVKG